MVDIVDLRNLVAEAEGTTDAKASQENFASGYDLSLLHTVSIYSLVNLFLK
jgi:hypothetical protein